MGWKGCGEEQEGVYLSPSQLWKYGAGASSHIKSTFMQPQHQQQHPDVLVAHVGLWQLGWPGTMEDYREVNQEVANVVLDPQQRPHTRVLWRTISAVHRSASAAHHSSKKNTLYSLERMREANAVVRPLWTSPGVGDKGKSNKGGEVKGAEVLDTFQTTLALDTTFTDDGTHFYKIEDSPDKKTKHLTGIAAWTNAQLFLNQLCND
jgi:hypothetical protein